MTSRHIIYVLIGAGILATGYAAMTLNKIGNADLSADQLKSQKGTQQLGTIGIGVAMAGVVLLVLHKNIG